uniref:Uncharacterized protein n=1 Tax=Brassica campestris TaxID=3711 RepID=A0A3P5ZJ62_BRACM|nr:unnamed protein product [Brassica rapa]
MGGSKGFMVPVSSKDLYKYCREGQTSFSQVSYRHYSLLVAPLL